MMLFVLFLSLFQLNNAEEEFYVRYCPYSEINWINNDTIIIKQRFITTHFIANYYDRYNISDNKGLINKWSDIDVEFIKKYMYDDRGHFRRKRRERIIGYSIKNKAFQQKLNEFFLKDQMFKIGKGRIISYDYDNKRVTIFDENFREIYSEDIKIIRKTLNISEDNQYVILDYVDRDFAWLNIYRSGKSSRVLLVR